jgi:hypothetical protein
MYGTVAYRQPSICSPYKSATPVPIGSFEIDLTMPSCRVAGHVSGISRTAYRTESTASG